MPAYVKKDYILSQIEAKKLSYYTVTSNGSMIDEQQSPSMGWKEAMQKLEECFDMLESGTVDVKISDKTNKQKGSGGNTNTYTYSVRIGEAGGSSSKTDNTVFALIKQMNDLQLQMQQERFDRQLLDMKREFTAKKVRPAWYETDLAKQGVNYIGDLVRLANNPQQQAAGIHGIDDKPMTTKKAATKKNTKPAPAAPSAEDQQERVRTALARLAKADPNVIEHLEMLADLAENDSFTYSIAVGKLKSLSQ